MLAEGSQSCRVASDNGRGEKQALEPDHGFISVQGRHRSRFGCGFRRCFDGHVVEPVCTAGQQWQASLQDPLREKPFLYTLSLKDSNKATVTAGVVSVAVAMCVLHCSHIISGGNGPLWPCGTLCHSSWDVPHPLLQLCTLTIQI